MRKQGLKKLEEVWKSSHMTVPVSGEKKEAMTWTRECTEVRLRALYPQKTCKRKGLGHTVYLVEENLCHILSRKLSSKNFLWVSCILRKDKEGVNGFQNYWQKDLKPM